MKQCNQMGPHGKCTRSWKRRFGVTKTNCTQFGLTHVFNVPEQAPNMPHTDKDEDKDEDGDLTMEDRMTTRSNSQTTGTMSPVGSATDMVRRTSRHNDYQQMYEDGMAYRHGSNFKKTDLKRGQLMIEASASSGFPMAVAYCHYQGWNGLEEDEKKAFEMFVKIEQENNGYDWAQFLLGDCCLCGQGTDQDYTKAVEWLTKASAQGNSVAMSNLGQCYTQASTQGDSGGMHNLGTCYHKGHGCDQDYTKAVEWFTKASAQGDSDAMVSLGWCCENGHGCDQDYTKAVEWYTKASAQGNSNAMFNLGVYYYPYGHRGRDSTTAFKWFAKASAQGHRGAMNNLGLCWKHGWGCDQNQTTAFEWFKKSAQLGDKYAQDNLNSAAFSKRRKTEASASTSDSDDELL